MDETASQSVPPAPLAYESPRDQIARMPPVNVLGMVIAFAFGFGLSFVAIVLVSMSVAPPDFERTSAPPQHPIALGVYALLLLVTVGLLVLTIRLPGWRLERRWGLLGGLVGTGVSLLLGGVCFMGR
ncbi:MAG TPA: hypothetical protein VFC46_09035 [Humisphaera sp.]|nr:hypothetical protein [Humisphaera sp.]